MKPPKNKEEKIRQLLARNVEDVIERGHLEFALRSGKKLRVKLGIDPTGEKIHIGRAVALWKLREFQDLGHKAVLIIGDFTAMIGDPSDKLAKRPMLTKADIKRNLKNYLPQIGKIVDLKKAEVRHNSEWLGKLNFRDIAELAEIFTVQQMIERENFKARWDQHKPISLRELTYPIMQGYDSVAIKADVELGGTDQLFNLLAGRKVQEHYGQKPQDVILTSMILGLDGRKMSTSWGNVVNITNPPTEQFGGLMSMRDEMIIPYLRALTDMPESEIKAHEVALAKGENPKNVKEQLALAVVTRYHGQTAARAAMEKWERLFSKKEALAADIPTLSLPAKITVLDLVMKTGVASSKSEARRLIAQGAVCINDAVKKDPAQALQLSGGEVFKVGKKTFFRIKI